ncbi:MAG TPA: substrate-binding domain-containing protein [Roseiflexaceae bacterium]|nr:substrate-binding domain-containing protein [Roseiflexaceae bacterium]
MLRISRFLAVGYIVLCLAVLGGNALIGPLGYAPFPLTTGPARPPITVTIWYSTEKSRWLEAAAEQFQAGGPTYQGRPIQLQLLGLGSREMAERVARQEWGDDPQPTVISPASSLWVETLRSEWRARGNNTPVIGENADAPRPLVLTPLVLVGWEQRARFLWPDSSTNFWGSLHDAVANQEGWPAIAGPTGRDWGLVKFGHTSPLTSNSGTQTLLLLAYAFHNKTNGLTSADVSSPEFLAWLTDIESSVQEFGESTGTFMENMVLSGPGKYDAVAVYENLALQYVEQAQGRWGQPVKIYYPPATLLSDHPYATLQGPWVSPEQRGAANVFRDYLLSTPVQQVALQAGFRPADPSISLAAADPNNPFERYKSYGVQLNISQQVESPPSEVLTTLLDVWRRNFNR